jgi:ELWxxDGT repeat protein
MRLITVLTVALALGGVPGAHAQAPYLVKDIWPGVGHSEPTLPVPFGDRVFFGALSPELGRELWSSGGTEESTTVLDLMRPTAASRARWSGWSLRPASTSTRCSRRSRDEGAPDHVTFPAVRSL